MCKVDELDDAVDHAVPQGNQGINTPDVQPIDDLEQKLHSNTILPC